MRSVSVYSVTRCALLASLLLSLSRSARLFHRSNCFIQLLHPSRCSQTILTVDWLAPPTSARFNGCAIAGTSYSGVWDPWSAEYHSCKLAVLLYRSRDQLRSNICTVLRCWHLLDTEISILNSFLFPEASRVNVFRSLSCSQPIRQRMCRRAVTLYLNLHWNSRSMYMDLKDSPT